VLCEAGTLQALRLRLMLPNVTLVQLEACQDKGDGNLHNRQQLRRPASSRLAQSASEDCFSLVQRLLNACCCNA
jgi:hypothetical protein